MQDMARSKAQAELAQAGVEGVGALFGGPLAAPLIPRCRLQFVLPRPAAPAAETLLRVQLVHSAGIQGSSVSWSPVKTSVMFCRLRYLDMEAFVEEATSAEAVVWLSLQGGAAAGPLQHMLEQWRIPFTGAPIPQHISGPWPWP